MGSNAKFPLNDTIDELAEAVRHGALVGRFVHGSAVNGRQTRGIVSRAEDDESFIRLFSDGLYIFDPDDASTWKKSVELEGRWVIWKNASNIRTSNDGAVTVDQGQSYQRITIS